MQKWLIPVLLFLTSALRAQVLDLSYKQLDYQLIYFKPEYIKEHQIKKIEMVYSEKPDGERILDKSFYHECYYSRNGLLSKEVEYIKEFNRILDTTIRYFYFDKLNHLSSIRTLKNKEYQTRYFSYDEKGRMIKNQLFKEDLSIVDDEIFKVDGQKLLSTETFTYEDFTVKQYKKHFINDESREYKYSITNLDEKVRIKDVYEAFAISGIYEESLYEYDKEGRILSIEIKSNSSGDYTREWFNKYEGEFLLEQKILLNAELTGERFLFYEKGLLDSELTRKTKSKSIDLVKYNYSFYK